MNDSLNIVELITQVSNDVDDDEEENDLVVGVLLRDLSVI